MRKFKVSNNLSSFFLKNEKKRQEIKKKEKKQAVTKNDRSGKVERTELIKKDKRVSRQKVLDEEEINDYIKYAIETESKRLKDIKKYD